NRNPYNIWCQSFQYNKKCHPDVSDIVVQSIHIRKLLRVSNNLIQLFLTSYHRLKNLADELNVMKCLLLNKYVQYSLYLQVSLVGIKRRVVPYSFSSCTNVISR